MDEISLNLLYKIEEDLDELFLPYKMDISIYEKLNNEELKEHIDRVGKKFYLV